MPGAAAYVSTRAEVDRGEDENLVLAEGLLSLEDLPSAGIDERHLALKEVLAVLGRGLRGVVGGEQRTEPGAPLDGLVPVEEALGGLIALAVDEVATEGLEHGSVGVGPPLGGVPHRHVNGVAEAVELGELVEGTHELVLRPRLVDRGDGDTGFVEGRLTSKEAQRGVVGADGVELVVPDAFSGVDDLSLEILRDCQWREVSGPGPVGHDRAVKVEDVGQIAGDCG